ncbi:hypothetical protein D3875_02575 [Deinococcus cavernae]|uniref:Uncharacterized protein n=1 Tax=Deinococcus cavernae TaxID=2320857 RepID=A0A418VFM8_9DEIO|nr:hypothetical protein [Deinococcus cavernae]RJF74898.1 hypothetical protein D3875_02575 [Deinococcus cavernae]
MAVNFRNANGQPSTVQNIYTTLHTVLILAGWELVYADADAIGTGTAANPAWSKAPTTGAAAGLVIYRMPAMSGFATRWCVEIKPMWATSATLQKVQFRLGTDATAGGVLSSPGSTIEAGSGNNSGGNNTSSTEWYVAAYEHGLLVALPGAAGAVGYLGAIERRRRLDDTILDDLTAFLCSSNASGVAFGASSNGWSSGSTRTRLAQGGEIDAANWVVMKTGANAVPSTLNRMDGATGIPAGPFSVSGGMAGFPRLFMLVAPNDAPPNVDVTRFVDGSNHAYLPATSLSSTFLSDAAQYRVCIAKD